MHMKVDSLSIVACSAAVPSPVFDRDPVFGLGLVLDYDSAFDRGLVLDDDPVFDHDCHDRDHVDLVLFVELERLSFVHL